MLTETESLPRWQCGLCTRLYEIESCGHWDGPLGGGNDLLRRGALNGWFFNHKAEFLFYESYLDPANCNHVPEAIPLCPLIFGGGNSSSGVGSGRVPEVRGVGVGHAHHHAASSHIFNLIR